MLLQFLIGNLLLVDYKLRLLSLLDGRIKK